MTATACCQFGGRRLTQIALLTILALVATTLSVIPRALASSQVVIYAPQPQRGASWDGVPTGFNSTTVQSMAANDSYVIVNKLDFSGDIHEQIQDVNNILLAAAQHQRSVKVFAYYQTDHWMFRSVRAMLPYSNLFPTDNSWYLRDYAGNLIPYYTMNDPQHLRSPAGYVVDTANTHYRQWLVFTMSHWLQLAGFSGVALDSTNVIVGNVPAPTMVGNGRQTWNQILCGPDAGNTCARTDAMNQGMVDNVSAISDAVHAIGKEVLYNGIAPSDNRGPTRNLGLLNYADMASNESFCYASDVQAGTIHFTPLTDDWDIMAQEAAAGKKVVQMTNYVRSDNTAHWGSYCAAAFLMGWQPGSSYWVYHKNPSCQLPATEEVPEFNLNLGNPLGNYAKVNNTFSRKFANGYLLMNITGARQPAQVPQAMTLFANGQAVVSYPAGAIITVPPKSAMFFLNNSYLYPRG